MARIAGVTIPDSKRIVISLTYVFGIGKQTSQKILNSVGIDESVRTKELTEDELNKIRDHIAANYDVEGDLQQRIRADVTRLKEIGSYRGQRHKNNLPARGQRTKTNARTKRGRRATVGSGRAKAPTKT